LFIAYVVLAFLYELFATPQASGALAALGFLFIALWMLWAMLPDWFRRFVRRSMGKGGRGEGR
jgi:hypothetical protein